MYRIGKEEVDAIAEVIEKRILFRVNNTTRAVEQFEKEWADTVGAKYALCVSGGTSALICALAGIGIGPGDEVIVPGYTFMASALAVCAVGGVPIIAEIDESMTLDPADFERKITKYTRAVIPVHINGFPCNMHRITQIADKHSIKIVEDTCQADGGSYKGKRLGTWGDAGAYSFNDYKILTAGEGGAVVTDDAEVYQRALVYHDGGSSFRPYAEDLTIKVFAAQQYRVSEIVGAIMRVQLTRLEGILADLRANRKKLVDAISSHPNIKIAKNNDPEGDCATTIALTFPNAQTAEKFAAAEGVNGFIPINSGKHVYANWEPIIEKRIGHHPGVNPFNFEQNKNLNQNYTKDMCPATLDILARTVFLSVSVDWHEETIEGIAAACRKAADTL